MITFKDQSTGTPIYWAWDFGNGQISTQKNPSVTYTSPGTYTVTLVARNKNGANSIQKTDYITVYPSPAANFSSNLNVACSPAPIQFTDASVPGTGTVTNWAWDFGDGSTSNQANPSHAYSATGFYTVALTVKNSGGCSNTTAKGRFIRIVQGVQPAFAYNQVSNSCTAPYQLNFINQTAGPGNLTYSWDFGNGSSSGSVNPTASYPANNTYTVILTATSDFGCSDTAERILSLSGSTAVITAPDNACSNGPVNFINGSSPAPVSSTWDFGDGTKAASLNPAKTYTAPSTYTVKLVNTYASCLDSTTKTINILNGPALSITADHTNSCQAPFTVNFRDTSSGGATWLWDFGDGSTSNLQNPPHTYNAAGVFDVKLTVNNATGCTNSITQSQFIKIATPTIALGSAHGCVGDGITPVPNISAVDGIQSYAWTATGATPSTSTLASPSFVYATSGFYTLSLTVTTTGGCTASGTFTNAVLVGRPTTPVIVVDSTPTCGRDSIRFTSTATPATQWAWDFGDGTVEYARTVSHSYNSPGDFHVILYLTDSGCQTVGRDTVHVNPPIAGFSYKAPTCTNKFQITFTDTSKLGLPPVSATYLWDFGDSAHSTSTVQSPGFTYPNTGPAAHTYYVTETVTNGSCSNVITLPVIVGPTIAAFTPTDTSVCKNSNFNLVSTSSNPSLIATYTWKIDANPDTTVSSPTYTASIPTNGPHTIKLTIADSSNCKDSTNGTVHVTGPTAKFVSVITGVVPGGCRNSPIAFTDQSIPYPGDSIKAWSWNFGDSTSQPTPGPGPTFTHPYADTGTYTVRLKVTDNIGCTDTITGSVPVQITAPQAQFATPDTFYCPNAALPFIDSSQGTNLTYSWNFGDGSARDTAKTPSHSFPTSGQKYTVKLKVTDQAGCSDSVTRTNYITIQKPIASFTLEDSTTLCPPLEAKFTSTGQYYDSLYWDFGDGSTSTLPVTSHFYNNFDTLFVKLFLQGPGGCMDSATRRVFITNTSTSTKFQYSPLKACDTVLTKYNLTIPGYTKFTLNFGDGQADSSQNPGISHLYTPPGTYIPQLILQDSTGCLVYITAAASNAITVLGAIPFFSMDTHAFCDSGTVYFTDFTITNDGVSSKQWDFGDGAIAIRLNDSSDFDTAHYYTAPGTRIVNFKVLTRSGCSASYSDTLLVHQTPHPLIGVQGNVCVNTLLQFQGSLVTPDPTDSVNWAWSFGDGRTSSDENPQISYTRADQYMVALRTFVAFGCSDTTSQLITIHPSPTIKGPAEISTPVGIPVTIPFTYSSDATSFSWTPATDLSCIDCPNPSANPIFKTYYYVTVADSNHCTSSDSILVKTICNGDNYFVPNTFSPNNDGVNDVFYPRGSNLYNVQSMRIFNRWGQMIFERRDFPANNAADGWDGTFSGHAAPSDAYIYIIEVICNNAQVVTLKGDITLIR